MSGARAAVLAAQRNKNIPAKSVPAQQVQAAPAPRPTPSAWGNSAANLAYSNSARAAASRRPGTATPSETTYRPSAIDRHGSLMAATGAMAKSPRRRADSSPVVRPSYPDSHNAKVNALRAANHANTASLTPKAVPVGGASPNVFMPRSKFGSTPGSQPQVDDKAKEEAIRSSALAMAKAMYVVMEKKKDEKEAEMGASGAIASGRNRALSLSSGESSVALPMRFGNLQEHAERLARQRLQDMHDEEAQGREYREYYGYEPSRQNSTNKHMSLGNIFRRRRSSDESLEENPETTRQIHQQMTVFSGNLSNVDTSKRQSDRDNLLSIAQRKVQRELHEMDEKVYKKTGKATPALMHDWELKAQQHAEAEHQQRTKNFGRVDVGGGVYMDQEQVDELARQRVQPILHEIDTTAEHRIKTEADAKEEARLDAEREKEKLLKERKDQKNDKELQKQIKGRRKLSFRYTISYQLVEQLLTGRTAQLKEDARQKKAEEKEAKRLSKRMSKSSGKAIADVPTQSGLPKEYENVAMQPTRTNQSLGVDQGERYPYDSNAPPQLPTPDVGPSYFGSAAVPERSPSDSRDIRSSEEFYEETPSIAQPIPYRPQNAAGLWTENRAYSSQSVTRSFRERQEAEDALRLQAQDQEESRMRSHRQAQGENEHHMSGGLRTSTDTARAMRESMTESRHKNLASPSRMASGQVAEADNLGNAAQVPAAMVPAAPGTQYESLPAQTPSAHTSLIRKVTKKEKKPPISDNSGTSPDSPKSKGVKGWLKKTFGKSGSGDDEGKIPKNQKAQDNAKDADTVKARKEQMKGQVKSEKDAKKLKKGKSAEKPTISSPVAQPEGTDGPLGSNLANVGTGHAIGVVGAGAPATAQDDDDMYEASPPRRPAGGAQAGSSYHIASQGATGNTAYADQTDDPACNHELPASEVSTLSDTGAIDSHTDMITPNHGVEDPSTVSILSATSIERKRRQELEDDRELGLEAEDDFDEDGATARVRDSLMNPDANSRDSKFHEDM